MEKLEKYVFDEFTKMGITLQNSELQIMQALSNAIENWLLTEYLEEIIPPIQKWITGEYSEKLEDWLIEEYSTNLQKWLIENLIPSLYKFNYWSIKEFPKTFNKFIDKKLDNPDIDITECEDDKNIIEANYEEIKSND